MHLPALQKLLALFISGSILFTSVPVYAGETASAASSVTSEAAAEPDDTAGNSDEDVDGANTDQNKNSENLTDTSDANRETPAGSDAGSSAADDGCKSSDYESEDTEDYRACTYSG